MEAKLGTSWMRVDGGLDHISVGPLGMYGVNITLGFPLLVVHFCYLFTEETWRWRQS